MDVVITYVNGLDPVWQQEYSRATRQPALAKRYRDWGLLPYLLRGIERYMPFVDRVFLVVSGESQVPAWADTDNLHIVYHHDIIPERFLPTFNSTTIELFLHRIPGLSEEFVYFNDDFYPVAPMERTDFFRDGKIVMHFARHILASGMYKKQTRQSDRLARLAAGTGKGCAFVRPQHTCTPMLRSCNEEVYAKIKMPLERSITMLRTNGNANQYVYPDYLYYTGRVIDRSLPTQHCSMAVCSADRIAAHVLRPSKSIICINDVSMSDDKQANMRAKLHRAFETRFPDKSRFEK